MGPVSGVVLFGSNLSRHENCREGERCTGPGCHVYTGKTKQKQQRREAAEKARKAREK